LYTRNTQSSILPSVKSTQGDMWPFCSYGERQRLEREGRNKENGERRWERGDGREETGDRRREIEDGR
jgi:hypothetical protein